MRALLAAVLLLSFACEDRNESAKRPVPNRYKSSADLKPNAGKIADVPAQPAPATPVPEDKPEQGEGITPPGNISGAFLVCSTLKAPSDADPTFDVGCRFVDNEGGRAEMYEIAEKGIFDVQPSPGVQVKITPVPNVDWEALYTFTGPDAAQTTLAAMTSLIIVNFENTSDGRPKATVKEELWEVELPLYEWAPACKNNTCAFREFNANLYWAQSDGTLRDRNAAAASCDALVFAGYLDWRLPTQAEMQKAYDENIMSLYYPTKLNLPAGSRFWSSTAGAEGSSLTIDWFAPRDTIFAPLPNTDTAKVICVR